MATITKKNAHNSPDPGFGGTAYGNLFTLAFAFATNASGYFLDSDTATSAVGNGDKVILGKIPAGTKLIDMYCYVSDAFQGSSTATIGFEYCDGTDDTAVPEDDDFFCAAATIAATGIIKKTNVTPPVTLPKDAYLILTNAGAAQAAAGILNIEVIGQIGGPR